MKQIFNTIFYGGVMKQIRYAGIVILALSLTAPSLAASGKLESKWEKAKKSYIESLSSDNPGVKASAANFIRRYNITEATEALTVVLACDNCETVKIAAAMALVEVAGEKGVQIISDAMKTEENDLVRIFYRMVLQQDKNQEYAPLSLQ